MPRYMIMPVEKQYSIALRSISAPDERVTCSEQHFQALKLRQIRKLSRGPSRMCFFGSRSQKDSLHLELQPHLNFHRSRFGGSS